MFLENLSVSLLQICDEEDIGYAELAERSELSEKFVSKMVRRESAPTLRSLEKLCMGVNKTPDELLMVRAPQEELAYRTAMPVTEVKCFILSGRPTGYPVCPRCGMTVEREYQQFCDRCGQKLDWRSYGKMTAVFNVRKNPK